MTDLSLFNDVLFLTDVFSLSETPSIEQAGSSFVWAVSPVLRKARNVCRGLVQRYAPSNLKRAIWDKEYASGRWDALEHMPADCVYAHLEKHARGGDILDLGCGPGATGSEINHAAYRTYTGVDISEVAVAKAIARAAAVRRNHSNSYVASDITTFTPAGKYDVIVFGDSIYYVPLSAITSLLVRLSASLKEDGVFLVRLFDPRQRYVPIILLIEENFEIIERQLYFDSQITVLAFRPR